MRILPIFILAAVAACASPREACIDRATHDLRVFNALISEIETTLRRGYAFKSITEYEVISEPCGTGSLCKRIVPNTIRKAVAVDIDAEKRMLQNLRDKEKRLTKRVRKNVRACQVAHPE